MITAQDGKDGYKKALEMKPDIIISDIRMPVWDGLTMIGKLYNQSYRGKIFLLTGYAEFEYAQKALHFHVSEYILKPIVPSKLKAMVEKTILSLQQTRQKEAALHPQTCHLVTEEDSKVLESRLMPYHYTEYFIAVIYIESERHLPPGVKEALINEKHHYVLSLPDKHYRGILIGFQNHVVKHGQIASVSKIVAQYPHLVCAYDIKTAPISSWSHVFDGLQNCIPWSITYRLRFFAWQPLMEASPEPYVEDEFLKKELQRLHCSNRHEEYGKLLIKALNKMQKAQRHPKHIQMTALSGLIRLDSKQAYLEAVNQMSDARTMNEIVHHINAYFLDSHEEGADCSYSRIVKSCIAEIEKNYQTPISLNSTADKLGITPQYLSRLFSRETSQSFIDYLTSYRMEKAKALLRNTSKKINVICAEVGYPDAKYFCTLFKKLVGVSPNQYRDNS